MVWTRIRWGYQFQHIGKRTILGAPTLLVNPRRIRIGPQSILWPGWTLADLDPLRNNGGPKIQIGSWCRIHHDFHIGAAQSVTIGDYAIIAPRVFITDSDHVLKPEGCETPIWNELRTLPVVIEHDCWIGVNAVVLKGVTLGHHSIVGAGAVVTKSFPPHSVLAGVPAKPINSAPANTIHRPAQANCAFPLG
jgi:acetyltransferase-like isoleucine patch superfamily enzyme